MPFRAIYEKDGHTQRGEAHRLEPSTAKSGRSLRARVNHHHSSSHDSTASNSLVAFGAGIYNRFRRVATPRQGHSRAERYSFLRRTAAAKEIGSSLEYGENDGAAQTRAGGSHMETPPSPPPKSAGLRSIFARSIWLRGGVEAGRDEGIVYRPPIEDDHDGITLDTGFDHIDVDDDLDDAWLRRHDSGYEELSAALNRDVNQLKSTFSWTTTSTSRYIDVADYFDADSDTDSTVSSLGVPLASTVSPFHSQQENSISAHAHEGDCDSAWLPVDPPTPRAGTYVLPYQRPHRKLFRKDSKTQIAVPPAMKMASHSRASKANEDQHHNPACLQCHLQNGCADPEVTQHVTTSKGKGRANSQSGLSDSIRNTVSFGRPAAVRSSSSPASLPFPHTRSRSLPGSGAATPAEVLSRASYNHEWAYPVSSRPISHTRSPSSPQPGSSAFTMSMQRSTTPTRMCQHVSDMRDVLRGVQSGIRPSTPIPGMPPVPPKNRPPPTSFRPVSAGGRERGRSRTPMSSAAFSQARFSGLAHPLTRSQSHRMSVEPTSSLRSRTRSLESLRGTAQALASASTAPLRNLWRARSFIRHSHNGQSGRSATDANDDEDGVWVCVDIKPPVDKAKSSLSSEGPGTCPGASGFASPTESPI
ncbi:uncharacterized protein FOMMEDRAFT_16382 [Fomitiporia mediterranea MF3/22]|uniref:uncharacterized protein n=1 Tax=Fomitiporia mediterranea (strain MF3/22) TaxID=694068 RepID=UPI0004408A98|nr:uncharacterized protein FOMMEDRAFT_16382 [Fomitiporia mediterranea MF3/22]EJD07775.1 hypothetical protein FOMMEDRAFT_16382 [Fomitiporia mediterranea MF3/22]